MKSFKFKQISFLLFAFILSSFCLQVFADNISDVDATTQKWATAFNHKSTNEIVSLYASDAVGDDLFSFGFPGFLSVVIVKFFKGGRKNDAQ